MQALAFGLDACGVSAPALFDGEVPPNPECTDYAVPDEYWRNVAFNDGDGGVEECDLDVPGWYRFEGDAGTRMPETAPDPYDCGTDAPGWLDGAHPVSPGETASRTVCYHWSGDTCNWSNSIQVTHCGSYFVYDLVDPPAGCLAYCAE